MFSPKNNKLTFEFPCEPTRVEISPGRLSVSGRNPQRRNPKATRKRVLQAPGHRTSCVVLRSEATYHRANA